MKTQAEYLDTFTRAYKVAMLWAETDNQDEPLDKGRDLSDIHPDTHEAMEKDCASFLAEQWEDLKDLDPEQCGHDFWLTRQGHGAGFWSRGNGEAGERLSAACGLHTNYPEQYPYVGGDGYVHI